MRHFYMHETRRKYIFMVFLTSDFAIFCCSWNRDTISCRDVSRTIPPIIISFNMKWTLNIVQKLLYDFIEKKFETNHTVHIPYCMLRYATRSFYSVLNSTFVNVKYQVQLTNIFKTPIQGFHKNLKLNFFEE